MNKSVISLSHCDLDALGCELSISHKFKNNVKYFSTNYLNIDNKIHEIEDYIRNNEVKFLIISDISFSSMKDKLIRLLKLNIKTAFIDHHEYSENFFEDIKANHNNVTIVFDQKYCAAKLTYDYLKIQDENLSKVIDIIDVFDTFKILDNRYKISLYLNEYFWDKRKGSLFNKITDNEYKLPKDFKKYMEEHSEYQKEKFQKLEEKNLIMRTNYASIVFVDEIFNFVLLNEFLKHKQKFVIIANSYGIIRVRINQFSNIDINVKRKIKLAITGDEFTGHENAFSFKIENNTIIENLKRIDSIILEHLN